MAAKPETRLIERVHRALDGSIYREKTNNPYRAGMPDVYYEGSGTQAMAWVEYKYRPTKFKAYSSFEEILALATPIQQRWIVRCSRNATKVAMIVGFNDGTAVFCSAGAMKPVTCVKSKDIAHELENYIYAHNWAHLVETDNVG